MNVIQFAQKCGLVLIRCEKEWGGTHGYYMEDSPLSKHFGYRSELATCKAWVTDRFGTQGLSALKSLGLKMTSKETTK